VLYKQGFSYYRGISKILNLKKIAQILNRIRITFNKKPAAHAAGYS